MSSLTTFDGWKQKSLKLIVGVKMHVDVMHKTNNIKYGLGEKGPMWW